MPTPSEGAPGRRLAIDADLDLSVDGHAVAIRGDGERLRIEVDEAQTAWQLFQSNRPGRHLVRSITDTLDVFGIDVDVVVGERSVVSVGPSAQGGPVAQALGLPSVQVTAPPEATWVAVGLAALAGLAVGLRR